MTCSMRMPARSVIDSVSREPVSSRVASIFVQLQQHLLYSDLLWTPLRSYTNPVRATCSAVGSTIFSMEQSMRTCVRRIVS